MEQRTDGHQLSERHEIHDRAGPAHGYVVALRGAQLSFQGSERPASLPYFGSGAVPVTLKSTPDFAVVSPGCVEPRLR